MVVSCQGIWEDSQATLNCFSTLKCDLSTLMKLDMFVKYTHTCINGTL